MSAMFQRLALLVAPLLTTSGLTPAVALACAVCGGGNPANRFAFFVSTMALSLLPLGLFVGGLLWLRSRIRRRSADEFTERKALTPPAVAAAAHPLPDATTPHTR